MVRLSGEARTPARRISNICDQVALWWVRCRLLVLPVALCLVGAGAAGKSTAADPCDSGYLERLDLNHPAARRWLPRPLFEISGLSAYGSSLIAHDDNVSALWSVPVQGGRALVPAGPLTPVRGDFEDLAIVADTAYLLRSNGDIMKIALTGADAGATQELPSGLHGMCNFEGLAALAASDLLLACKTSNSLPVGMLHLFRVRLDQADREPQRLSFDVTPLLAEFGLERLRPSALEWLPDEQSLLVLAGKERVLIEADLRGRILAVKRLGWFRHRQAEALTVDDLGRLVVGDERNGWFATLTVYAPVDGGDMTNGHGFGPCQSS